MIYKTINSPIGMLMASADDLGICSLVFCDDDVKFDGKNAHICLLEDELDAYFKGLLKEFSVPICLKGTEFQKKVWQTLLQIKYANTISYGQEALNLGHIKACRAVANANGKNPISIVVPCHRVIAKDGTIGGYSGGLWRKKFLLDLEKANA